ncbi:LysM peptidoglycan-binding domain-containing protein [Macrococcoides canis]|uniref:LysM peptidoglycan-binding domain-containing protein n=1 Tax=Macrococcoides canis TaxID=1855823 RepID=A0A4R6C619_9STAP|nr:LysM peptidoglycan-binding domain-containing protein [Macrococcus canis]MEE1107844.1 LysM peptidoglycan-binding domain-containing protein [Macrococcus canis]TDM17360.1 LysM peptidoglycan-binding domain-containing protein [Macrococcus canis]TDM20691.1 LysM peptidoglycan-binding domain-containing protein [Macrococcus canis]TDM24761.1 LysM peptidoglycan-binding domain-containing protein [Macrococcus canis]TDM32284.1 LysM peptidoglycan-binding domain-containing protein [Macrococcus canis]
MKKALVTIAGITAVTGVASQAYASEHHVQAGDTLWAIAQENGTSVDALKALNNLNSDLILVGQTLKVENTDTYTVKQGDTLQSIASQFDLTVNDIMAWNNLTSETIEVGTELKLTAPVAEVQSESVQPITETSAPVQRAEAPVQTAAPVQPVAQQVSAPVQTTVQYTTPVQTAAPATQSYEAPAAQSYEAPAQQKAPAKSYNAPVNGNVAQIANSVAAGKSYVYGANSATAVDCSAFAQQVLAAQGKSIPRTTYAQMAAGTRVSTPQAGDLVFFNGGSHVGVYIGNGQMIDALNPSEGIGQRSVSYVNGTVDGYYRF